MSKEIYISSTPHETRLAIVEDEALTEIYYERENEYTLAGSIYNGRVTRVLPGMQSSFVEIGLERDAFLYITDFMEEAPDSEEFDTAPAGERTARAPRLGNGEPAGEAGGRGESGGRSESGGRGGERGDRGGRGRRGGRDRERSHNADRPTGSGAAPRRQDGERGQGERASGERGDALRGDAGDGYSDSAAPRELNEGGETGEGAPGAEASRRWRGRRGRRRGRGASGQAGEQAGQTGGSTQENSAADYPAAQGYSEVPGDDDDSFERESTLEIGAAAAHPGTPPAERSNDGPRGEGQTGDRSGERGRRDRGREGRDRDGGRSDLQRRERGQRPDQRPQRDPHGFEPSRNLYGMDSGAEASGTGPIANAYPDEDFAAGSEPIELPGESLSKYRKGGDEPSTAKLEQSASVPLAPPANLYTLAAGWDGGATLPGETLSRRRPADSRTDSREGRDRSRREFNREPRRDVRPDRSTHSDSRSSDSRNVSRDGRAETRQESRRELRNDAPVAAAAVVATTQQGYPATKPEPAAPVAGEYEPSDASASYRVDPVPPSEFRQSAPTLESAPEPKAEDGTVPEAPVAAVHDMTSISPAGEMHSESAAVLPVEAQHPVPMEVSEAASPIRTEGAAVSPESSFDLPPAQTASGSAAAAAGFTPGHGQLAEEILDEEDTAGTTIQASSIEEMDDLDEEAVEGAADLGTMLREMSIDQITRTAPELEEQDDMDEEEDFEEDDLDEEDFDEESEDEGEESEEGDERGDRDGLKQAEDSDDDQQEQAARAGNADDAEFYEAQFGQSAESNRTAEEAGPSTSRPERGRDGERRPGRRDGRRDGRRGRGDRGDRPRSTGGSGDRDRSGHSGYSGGGRGRHSMQTTDLPAISDLLKPGQEILVQIAKEPIAKKGARITSHIALPGRFLVFMPTVSHIGVSRKIESDGERRRLKEILLSERGEASGGFIVRTAAEGASEEELRSDLRFLLNLWADIKARSESSKSPALIYHDLNLIERILRDQVTDNFSAIWVDTEAEYERVLRFLQRFQPSLIRRVKLYLKDTPLFEQFGITEEINKALRSKVWLKSGGSIVINQTEALVAIDINTGKYVGKTARLEDTIVKTNLDAIPEIVRQIRLRDLGGIIIIDFIDMDERKNRNRVMAALEDELKSDRAPSKVLQFNDFGLVAITRKRVKQSLERTLSTTCSVCEGTGMVKSPITVCNDIYIEMRKMHKTLDRGDIMLRVHPEVVKQLKASGAKWLLEMEEMVGRTILVKSDPALHPERFDIH